MTLLVRWNLRINLVSRRDIPHLWQRHIADSMQLAPLIPPGLAVVDLGSGAGFPGLILALCLTNHITLVEADARKASFLREAARQTHADVTVVNRRIELLDLPPVPVITARALAPLPILLEWAMPLLRPEGFCLFLKGRRVEDELTSAQAKWHMAVTRVPSQTDDASVILMLRRLRRLEVRAPIDS